MPANLHTYYTYIQNIYVYIFNCSWLLHGINDYLISFQPTSFAIKFKTKKIYIIEY